MPQKYWEVRKVGGSELDVRVFPDEREASKYAYDQADLHPEDYYDVLEAKASYHVPRPKPERIKL